MKNTGNIVVCAVGLKGFAFVEGLLQSGVGLGSIVTYAQADDQARGFERLCELAARHSINLLETRHPVPRDEDLTFLVGWQHLLSRVTPSTMVFHDSLLPRYRGFAPTVTALINGDHEIGVTALQPSETTDEGPIISQRSLPIFYPIKIAAALTLQAGLMKDLGYGAGYKYAFDSEQAYLPQEYLPEALRGASWYAPTDFGYEKTIKERILEYLAVRTLNPHARGSILCFVGPPGVGKTSLGQSIAEALGRKFTRVSLGGVRDEAEVRGHRRTYVGAIPGRILHALQRCETRTPVLMLDEVDKMGADVRGDPTSALLEVLDPAQNSTFVDHYLEVPFDLSGVMFIATANSTVPIPDPLLDRMEQLTLVGYTPAEKLQIAKRYLMPRQLKETGLDERAHVVDGALERLIGEYTREAGVRQLEREIQGILRKAALEVVEGGSKSVKISSKNLEKYAGQPKVQSEVAGRAPEIGVATGLAWTPVGGDIMFIEAIRMPGKGQITLTGQLGDVMKESAQAAWSLLRARASALGIPQDAFTQSDVHLHVPAGGVPKDGPSAGITIAAALASLLCRRPSRHDVAMTGELTLRGRVLPIGGLKEKLTAAARAGVTQVLVPARNKNDLIDLPEEVRKLLDIKLVETIDDVLALALLEVPPSEERLERRSGGIRVVTPQTPPQAPPPGQARR